ncbi:ScbR family autoregulator-binding transcription factor [Streptomyces sp. NPDC048659]|uniref:ScbR family autoregulator-binding transcription factor n=1 Tax=Streptomyces sp. NPDC048659 TaxID=3155489 RepID=UPI0034160850
MQDRAAKTRRLLIRSAAEVFDRGGFAGSSIGQICALAGVSQGALHFHFRNKQALGEAVQSAAVEILLCVTGQVPSWHPAPLQLLVDTSHALARRVAGDLVLRAGFGLGHDPGWAGAASPWRHWRDWVRGVLQLARRQGSLAPGVDLDDAVAAITAVMAGVEGLERDRAAARPAQSVTPFWRLVLPQLAADGVRGRIDAAGGARIDPAGDAAGGPPRAGGDSPSARRRHDGRPEGRHDGRYDGRHAPHACGAMTDGELCGVPVPYRELSGSAW